MKNDTSTNIIDLDTILNPTIEDEVKEIIKSTEAEATANWDDILTEWCYKLPKGYPTVVDGKFVDANEVRLLNELLVQRGLNTLTEPEQGINPEIQAAHRNPTKVREATQLGNNWEDREESVLKILAKQISQYAASIGVEQDEEGESTSTAKTSTILIVPEKSAKDREIIANFLRKQIKNLFRVEPEDLRPGKPEFKFTYNTRLYKCKVKELAKITESDTDVKEGFSLLFGYYPNTQAELSANNVEKYAAALKKWLEQKNVEANLDDSLKKKLIRYLDRIVNLEAYLKDRGVELQSKDGASQLLKIKKDFVSFLNQGISHGETFSFFFEKNPDFYIERGTLFDDIRKAGKKISNSDSYDKWCPGDVYFIRNGSENDIQKVLDAIDQFKIEDKQNPTDQQVALLQRLNGLFSPVYDKEVKKQTPIVAVSLKMASAQGGKLKSALKPILKKNTLKVPKTFNLDQSEVSAPTKTLIDSTKRYFKDMITALGKEKQTKYTYSTTTNVGDPIGKAVQSNTKALDDLAKLIAQEKDAKKKGEYQDLLKFKFASYKMINFIISNYADGRGDEVDQALKALAAFGLGVVEQKLANVAYINPPFFKVIANSDGSAMLSGDAVRPQFFQPGAIVTLSTQDVSGKIPQIDIIDSFPQSGKSGMKGLKINFNINLASTKGGDMIPQNDTYELSMNFRPNGSSQITVELQKVHLK